MKVCDKCESRKDVIVVQMPYNYARMHEYRDMDLCQECKKKLIDMINTFRRPDYDAVHKSL